MSDLAAPPIRTPLIESARDPLITRVWAQWLRAVVDRTEASATRVTSARVSLTGQSASIAATSLVPLATGLYRVTWQFRVTTADGVSSSLRLLIQDTEGGVSCSQASLTYTGDATNAPQSGALLVNVDPASPLQYATVYASNTPAQMVYSLLIEVEQIG